MIVGGIVQLLFLLCCSPTRLFTFDKINYPVLIIYHTFKTNFNLEFIRSQNKANIIIYLRILSNQECQECYSLGTRQQGEQSAFRSPSDPNQTETS